MFNDILKNFDENDYVYIIEGCMSFYASLDPVDENQEPCEFCGSYDFPYLEGYVEDIRKASSKEELYGLVVPKKKVKKIVKTNKKRYK